MNGRYRYSCEPAGTMIRALGGPRKLAGVLGVSPELVSQWNRPTSAGGTDGYVPPKYHKKITGYAASFGRKDITESFLRGGKRETIDVGRMSKIKGSRFENQVVNDLLAVGIEARRVPLSGADPNYPGDVDILAPTGRWIIQCKITQQHSAGGRTSIARMLSQVTTGRIAAGVNQHLVGMRRDAFVRLLRGSPVRPINWPRIAINGKQVLSHLSGHDALIFRRSGQREWMVVVSSSKFNGVERVKK